MRGIQGAAAALGVGLSVGGLAAFVKNSIDAADALNDLSKRTGVAATTIGGIGFAAQQAGGDLEGAARAFGKFNTLISEALGGNKQAAETFAKLGISLRDLKNQTPTELFYKTADAFASFEDGANKAAGGIAIFGKSWASVAGALDDGGEALRKNVEYFQKYSGVTEDLVRASDQFNDSLTKLNLLQRSFGNYLSRELLGPLQRLSTYMLEAKESTNGYSEAARAVAEPLKGLAKLAVTTGLAFKLGGMTVAAFAASLASIARLDFSAVGSIVKEFAADFEGVKKTGQDLFAIIDARSDAGASGAQGPSGRRGQRPAPNFTGTAASVKQATEKVSEFDRLLEKLRKDAADVRFELDNAFSTEQITKAQKTLADLMASKAWTEFDDRQKSIVTGMLKEQDALERQTTAIEQSLAARKKQAEAQQQIVDVFTDSFAQYREGNELLQAEIDLIGKDAETRELVLEKMRGQILLQQAISAGNEQDIELTRQLIDERLRMISRLASETRRFNETEQIRSIFASSFTDEISQVIAGTKSLSDAFRDMERQIVDSISRIAAQNIADAIFGKAGSGGGFGGFAEWFGALFSGGFANGTSFAPGGMALVGERGPEIVNLPRGSSVTPNHKIGGNVISINVNVPGGTNSASADRIALVTGQAVQRAIRRNG
jgi:hypothetical protein